MEKWYKAKQTVESIQKLNKYRGELKQKCLFLFIFNF